MKLAATITNVGRFFNMDETLEKLHDIGYRYVDIALGGEGQFSEDEKEWKKAVANLAEIAAKHGIKFVQAHSPNVKILDETRKEREHFLTYRSVEICDMLGIENVVVHTGYNPANDKDAYFEKNRDYFRQFFPIMEKTGVNILVENTLRHHVAQGGYYLLKGTDYVEFLEYVNHPLLNAVWDTGHGSAEGCQYENITAIGKYLKGLHIHDNNGSSDQHAMPYMGVLNLDAVINGLIDIDYKGYFTYETVYPLLLGGRAKRVKFEKDTRLYDPTPEMMIAAEQLVFTIGKCALEAYGVYEE